MTLRRALSLRGYSREEVEDIIQTWVMEIREGEEDPEELLREEGLEPDYVFELLNECL